MRILVSSTILLLLLFQYQPALAQFQEGEITRRKGEFLLVAISLGWELTPGQDLLIFSKSETNQEIGRGQVLQTKKGKAIIKIISENPNNRIQKGDWVASQNTDHSNLLSPFKSPRSAFKFKFGTGATPLWNLNQNVRQAFLELKNTQNVTRGVSYAEHAPGFIFEYVCHLTQRIKPGLSVDYIGNQFRLRENRPDGIIEAGQHIHNYNVLLNLYYFHEPFLEKFKIFAGVGVGFSFTHLKATIGRTYPALPENNVNASGTGSGMRFTEQFSVGLEIAFTRHWGISFESQYRFRRVWQVSSKYSGLNAASPVARIWQKSMEVNELDFSGGIITAGLIYYR